MSSGSHSVQPSSRFQTIFDVALREYAEKTGNDLATHPLATTLKACDSPDHVLGVLQDQADAFNQFRNGDWRVQIMKRLKPTVDILLALSTSGVLGEGIGLNFPPAKAIFAGIGLLLAAAKGVSTSYDALVELFQCFENYLHRLRIFTGISSIPSAMEGVLVKIMVELLSVLALATQQINQGRFKKFAKKLLGENEIETVLQRLDRLTVEEARMTATQTMEVVHGLFNNMKVVMEDGKASTDNIREALATMQQIIETMNKMKRDELQRNVRQWLVPPDPSINHNIACEAHYDGTAMWFLEGAVYKEWKETGSLLWTHGKPGSGKSVLCSSIINDIQNLCRTGSASVAFYYFDFKDTGKQDRRGLLSSLLTQLCARTDRYTQVLSNLYSTHGNGLRQPSEVDLVRCLREVLECPNQGKVYIIMDAVDECPNNSGMPSSREKVLNLVKELVSLQLPHVHICVASRPEVDIRAVLESLTTRCVSIHQAGGQRQDIIDYVESVVESDLKMRRWRPEDKRLVIDTLSRKADGMFRWVFCQLDTLRRCFPGSIRRVLDELPATLDETYARILLEIDEEKWEYALRLLQCLTVTCRPLRAKELAEVLAVELGAGGVPQLNVGLRPGDADEAVLSACSTLVAIVNVDTDDDYYSSRYYDRRVVQFSHFSVKEFLTSSRLATSRINLSRYHISPEPAHTVLAQSCISTLLHLDHGICTTGTQNFPLAGYAARNWVDHAHSSGVAPPVEDGMRCLFDPERPNFPAWVSIYDIDVPRNGHSQAQLQGSPLYYAAFCGFRELVKHLVTMRRQDPNAKGGTCGTPLHAAICRGHTGIAQFLLYRGADKNARDYQHTTPLYRAIEAGDFEVVKLLLSRGAGVYAQDEGHSTPLHEALQIIHVTDARALLKRNGGFKSLDQYTYALHHAARCGNFELVHLFLRCRMGVDVRDNNHSTPLHEASQIGHIPIAQALLRCGADVNAQDFQHTTPLYRAVEAGNFEVVKLLLSRGAGVYAQDEGHSTPLHEALQIIHVTDAQGLLKRNGGFKSLDQYTYALHTAAQCGNFELVRLFLRCGMGVDVRDNNYSTPLHEASQIGHIPIAQTLLDCGADVDARDYFVTSPLHKAARCGNLEVAELLLRFEADVNARDCLNTSPLHTATRCGNLEVVELLLRCGADVNVRDYQDASPLHGAVQYRNLEVVELLLRYGADVNARDYQGVSPLHKAVQYRNLEVVELLLGYGADVHAQDNDNSTPLHKASEGWKPRLVQEFLQCAADPNSADNPGFTPMHHASIWGHRAVAQLLLERGADVNARQGDFRTPLHLASLEGLLDTARLLVERGADIDARDDVGQTPFSIALARGHRKLARFLSNEDVEGHSGQSYL